MISMFWQYRKKLNKKNNNQRSEYNDKMSKNVYAFDFFFQTEIPCSIVRSYEPAFLY